MLRFHIIVWLVFNFANTVMAMNMYYGNIKNLFESFGVDDVIVLISGTVLSFPIFYFINWILGIIYNKIKEAKRKQKKKNNYNNNGGFSSGGTDLF